MRSLRVPIALFVMLLAGLAQARDLELSLSRQGELPLSPAPRQGARADTLFLFTTSGPGSYGSPGTDARGFTFDHEGGPAEAGWFGVDLTGQEGEWWHLADTGICAGTGTDMSQALPFGTGDTSNDHALWCGRYEVCGWENTHGYGTDWEQYAVLDLGPTPPEVDVVLDFAYRSDFEGTPYDWFEIRVDAGGVWNTVHTEGAMADRTYREISVTIPALEFGSGPVRIGFYFESDSAWSDQDGLFDSDFGAVWLDNIVATMDGQQIFATDFEDGLVPSEISFETPPGVGNLAALRDENFQEDPNTTNDTYAWTFYDPALANEDYPDGIIPFGPPFVHAAVQSPWLEVDQHGNPFVFHEDDEIVVEYMMYVDQPLTGVVFVSEHPNIAVRRDNGCDSRFVDDNTTFWPDFAGEWWDWQTYPTNTVIEASGGHGVEGIAIQLWVKDMCGFWCDVFGSGEPHTCAPYYDNVRVMVIREDLTAAESVPGVTGLLGAHPNPFNPKISIRYGLAEAGRAQLTVHDLAGRQVRELVNSLVTAGDHNLEWDGRDDNGHRLASGVYLLRFDSAGVREHEKLILLK